MKKNVWTAFLLVIGFAGFAAAQDAGDLPKVLRATVSAYEQLLSESELAATGQYEVKVLDTHKPIQRFRDIYFSQKKKRPIIDDQAFDAVYARLVGNWPGDTPWEGLFIGEGRHLKSGNEEQFFDGSIYAQRTIGGNVIVLNDEAILTRVPDYLGTFSTLNSNLEFGKSFGDSWSSSGVSLVELLDQAMSPKAEITLEGDYLKCTIPAFGGVSNVDLRIQIELEPGKVFLPKTIWVARSLAGKNVPIELLNGSKIEYMDYRLVNGKIYLPYAIKGTSYTSLESSFDDPQLRDELFKHTKLRVDPGVVIPLVEHTLRINSLTLRPKADGSSIQLPVTVGTIVKDRMLNKEYIFENSILKKANGLKNDSKNKYTSLH